MYTTSVCTISFAGILHSPCSKYLYNHWTLILVYFFINRLLSSVNIVIIYYPFISYLIIIFYSFKRSYFADKQVPNIKVKQFHFLSKNMCFTLNSTNYCRYILFFRNDDM